MLRFKIAIKHFLNNLCKYVLCLNFFMFFIVVVVESVMFWKTCLKNAFFFFSFLNGSFASFDDQYDMIN